MQRRKFTSELVSIIGLGALATPAVRAASFTEGDAALGVRTALERGATAAVGLLGQPGGFLDNPRVRIPLPGGLDKAAKLLRATGQGQRVDELITAMNRAAEAAVPEAKTLLISAVKSMSVDDARRIVTGGDNSVTTFFASKTRKPLATKFRPIVEQQTRKVALGEKYNAVAGRAAGFGLLKKEDANVEQYVTNKALDGLYYMIGQQERQIRQNPMATGSAILQKVFGR